MGKQVWVKEKGTQGNRAVTYKGKYWVGEETLYSWTVGRENGRWKETIGGQLSRRDIESSNANTSFR